MPFQIVGHAIPSGSNIKHSGLCRWRRNIFGLEEARTEILRPDQTQSLARIAAEYGFSSPSQFAQFLRRQYGVYPSEMLRELGAVEFITKPVDFDQLKEQLRQLPTAAN